MSNRVFKKLHGEKDLVTALGIELSESDDGSASFRAVEKPIKNRFELVNYIKYIS